ncbi:hypothetical protein LTR37_015928 [Vermiconidia calcicola]|uniref:Uncharacterized protein n=1 Tax=Vermiconidia calcicola TaxID=1690605 RepID=A0ACC3MPD2_9PEZI|nr:hypothetical protein LTR37_015928 [Vermiconidia calcicola]
MDGLLRCGKKFTTLMGIQHCDFKGAAFRMEKGEPRPVHVMGRVTIDAAFFRQSNPGYTRSSVDRPARETSSWEDLWCFNDVNDSPEQVENTVMAFAEMGDEDLLICSPTVLGFSYTDKMWLEFAVGGIGDINWNESAIENLVLPEGPKEAMLALAERRAGSARLSTGDITHGRTEGLNILLQ